MTQLWTFSAQLCLATFCHSFTLVLNLFGGHPPLACRSLEPDYTTIRHGAAWVPGF